MKIAVRRVLAALLAGLLNATLIAILTGSLNSAATEAALLRIEQRLVSYTYRNDCLRSITGIGSNLYQAGALTSLIAEAASTPA